MYFEEAIVKTYYRTYNNKKVPYNQLNLGTDSKFNPDPEKPETVGVIRLHELKELIAKADGTSLTEMEAKLNELQKEKLQLNKEVEELTSTAKSLASDVNKLKEEKVQLQEELLKNESNKELIIELQKEHKEELVVKDSEIAELNYKLNNEKDYSKALLVARSDLLNRNIFKRIANIEPESSKYVAELKKLPENVEANVVNEEND